MRTLVLAAMLLAALWLPARAAEPDQDRISFAQYRDWRVDFIAQRQRQIAAQLAADGLAAADRDRLTREKSYYDRQAAMPAEQRDRMFQARFELIDTNHDGTIDRAERSAWHDKQQARYRRQASAETRR